MRKVIGIGETILDIIFKDGKPFRSVPGGSTFNTMVSLGCLQIDTSFISELGNDRVGESILCFMRDNSVSTENIDVFSNGQTPISLAFLDKDNDAHYSFYVKYPQDRLNVVWPRINEDDILIFGSYFSVNPQLRKRITELVEYARERKAIIYYDPNFRSAHAHEAMKLMPYVLENFEYADIVKGSAEDFRNLFKVTDPGRVYANHVKFYCPNFIYTRGGNGVELFSPSGVSHFDVKHLEPVSTIGAGDSFNAGILFGLLKYGVTHETLYSLTREEWAGIIQYGIDFSSSVCESYDNYISKDFASGHKL